MSLELELKLVKYSLWDNQDLGVYIDIKPPQLTVHLRATNNA